MAWRFWRRLMTLGWSFGRFRLYVLMLPCKFFWCIKIWQECNLGKYLKWCNDLWCKWSWLLETLRWWCCARIGDILGLYGEIAWILITIESLLILGGNLNEPWMFLNGHVLKILIEACDLFFDFKINQEWITRTLKLWSSLQFRNSKSPWKVQITLRP